MIVCGTTINKKYELMKIKKLRGPLRKKGGDEIFKDDGRGPTLEEEVEDEKKNVKDFADSERFRELKYEEKVKQMKTKRRLEQLRLKRQGPRAIL